MFGSYEIEDVVDLDAMFEGDDAVWEEQSRTGLQPGKYQLRLTHFEPKTGTNNPDSRGFYFYFLIHAYENGEPVPEYALKMKLRKYFYVGKMVDGKLIKNSFTNNFTQFLISLGVENSVGGRKFSQASLENSLVMATLELGEKKLSTRENPNTGKVPDMIDETDPNTYVQFLQIKDNAPIFGIKDTNGNVQKAY